MSRLSVRGVTATTIARELRILADYLYPPIKDGKIVKDFGGRNRVVRKSGIRQSFKIHVGK
jgi:hypothetical protein